jgi:hypothetical protein
MRSRSGLDTNEIARELGTRAARVAKCPPGARPRMSQKSQIVPLATALLSLGEALSAAAG